MCFVPQWRALSRLLNLQNWSDVGVFSVGNVLRATAACAFSTSQLSKVVRPWCVLCILTCKCASRHNGAHFFDIATSKGGRFAQQRRAIFISHLARWLRTRRFSEPTCRPPLGSRGRVAGRSEQGVKVLWAFAYGTRAGNRQKSFATGLAECRQPGASIQKRKRSREKQRAKSDIKQKIPGIKEVVQRNESISIHSC